MNVLKSQLTPSRRRLVELMQRTNHGRITIHVRRGEPIFDQPPRVIKKIKIAADNKAHPTAHSVEFTLKKEVMECLDHLGQIDCGKAIIEIKNGLPFSIDVETEERD